jgi:hypothetical protein
MKRILAVLAVSLLMSVPAWAQSPTPTATPTPVFGACNNGLPYAAGCVFAGTSVGNNQPVSVVGSVVSDGTIDGTTGEWFYNINGVTGSYTTSGGQCTALDDHFNYLFEWQSATGAPANTPMVFNEVLTGGFSLNVIDLLVDDVETGQFAIRASAISSSIVLVGTCN